MADQPFDRMKERHPNGGVPPRPGALRRRYSMRWLRIAMATAWARSAAPSFSYTERR